jgi:hypothetical protein
MSVSYAFNNKLSSDFTIENNDGTEVLYLHKIILSSNEYFNVLFGDKFKKVDKLCFDNINIPKLLTYYLYDKNVKIKINELQFNDLILVLSLANEWLMFDYVNNIVNEYLRYYMLNVEQLIELNKYCKDVFTDDKVKKIITDDIKRIISGDELLKYKNMDMENVENLDLESKIILYTNFKCFKKVDSLFKIYKYTDIYNTLVKLASLNKNAYDVYSDFYNFISKIDRIILDKSCKSPNPYLSLNRMKTMGYIIESICPLSLRKIRTLNVETIRINNNTTEILINNIQSKISENSQIIIVDPIEYKTERKYSINDILKIKVNGIEVLSASKYKNIVIEIKGDLPIDKKSLIFVSNICTYV